MYASMCIVIFFNGSFEIIHIYKFTVNTGRERSVVGPVAVARGAVVKGRFGLPTNGLVD